MTLIFLFPGQSSRYPQILEKLLALHPDHRRLVDEASEILKRDLVRHYRAENPEIFACNRDVQIGVFLASTLWMRHLQAAGIDGDLSLGLSLGEWNHLVHIGALSFQDALVAVEKRGMAYDAGPRGAMASVFPIGLDVLQEILPRVQSLGVLEAVNLNSPRQQVLSGDTAALDAALKILEEEYYIQGVIIERDVPMHASIFEPVGSAFRKTLETLPFVPPKKPYISNLRGDIVEDPTRETFVEILSAHVHRPVLWQRSIERLAGLYPDALWLEVGPKAVLTHLMDRKWLPHLQTKKYKSDSAEKTDEHLASVIQEIQRLQAEVSR